MIHSAMGSHPFNNWLAFSSPKKRNNWEPWINDKIIDNNDDKINELTQSHAIYDSPVYQWFPS